MSERQKIGLIFATLLLLLVGGYFSAVEATYVLLGRETTGAVTKVSDVTRTHRGHEHTYREVEFTFAEPNGGQQTGVDIMDTTWLPPSNGVIKVQYTPGDKGRARVAGNVKRGGFILFGAGLAIVLVLAVYLLLDARKAYRPRPQKKKKRIRRYAND